MEAITHLPERKRTVFLMSVEEDMSLDEIASELKISRSAVKKHLYAAVRTIKEQLRLHARMDGWDDHFTFILRGRVSFFMVQQSLCYGSGRSNILNGKIRRRQALC